MLASPAKTLYLLRFSVIEYQLVTLCTYLATVHYKIQARIEWITNSIRNNYSVRNNVKTLSSETIDQLIKLEILNDNLEITPQAYVGVISRKPVNEQAEMLGVPLIVRPFKKNDMSPEKQFIRYFSSRVPGYIDGGDDWSSEGYIIKSLLSYIVPEFEHRSRKHNYSNEEIKIQVECILSYSEINIIEKCEVLLSSRDYVDLDFNAYTKLQDRVDKKYLRERFRCAKGSISQYSPIFEESTEERVMISKSKEYESTYIDYCLNYIELWRSLSKEEWLSLAEITLSNWSKMFAGWPDLTFYSESLGLTLVEIKEKDKIHTSQIYTILKLKEALGPKRLAVGWLNSGRINFSGQYYTNHMKEVISWFNTSWVERKSFTQEVRKI